MVEFPLSVPADAGSGETSARHQRIEQGGCQEVTVLVALIIVFRLRGNNFGLVVREEPTWAEMGIAYTVKFHNQQLVLREESLLRDTEQ